MQRFSKWFTQGMLILVPIAVTFFVIRWLVGLLGSMTAFLPLQPVLQVAVALAFIAVVGWLGSFWLTRWILRYGDEVLGRIPLVRTVYRSVKQMSEALADPGRFLGRPVLVRVGSPRTLVMGFFVEEVRVPHDAEPWACVFVPMSLNLTGGFNLFVPLADLVEVRNVDRENAFRFILTAGASMPSGLVAQPSGGTDAAETP